MRRASGAFALFSKTASRDGFSSSSSFPPPAETTSSLFFAPPPRTTRNVSTTRRKEGDEQNEEEEEEIKTRRTETFCLCKQVKINAKIRKDQGHCVYKPVVVDDIVKSKKQKEGSLAKRAHWTTLDASVDDAVRKMHAMDVGALVVMDFHKLDVDKSKKIHLEELYYSPKSNAIAGIVSERDYLRAVATNKVTDLTTVREIMTPAVDETTGKRQLISVEPYCSVLAAMQAMTTGHFRHIPVIDSELQTLEGIVSLGDVVKALIAEQDEEIDVLEDYITSGGK